MVKSRSIGIVVASISAFIASSLWYSPLLVGTQFLQLSGTVARPSAITLPAEILRNLLLASVITWLLARHRPAGLRSVLAFAGILWLGFPVTLLSGSVMWQNVPVELALIHAGDWAIKILLMSAIPWAISGNADSQPAKHNRSDRHTLATN